MTENPSPALSPALSQLNLVVADMDASVAFYRLLGLAIECEPGSAHAEMTFPSGVALELDTAESAALWDSAWALRPGGAVVLSFSVGSREAVDELHAALTAAGHHDHQPPYDAFWGARYAIVDDPDGNPVGLMSAVDSRHKAWPPAPPPAAGGQPSANR